MRFVSALLVAGLLLGADPLASAPRAAACTCAGLPSDTVGARQWLAQDYSDVTLVGVVESTMGSDSEPGAVMRAERVYKGAITERFSVTSSNCNGIVVPFKTGERWVLDVTRRDGAWWAHGCSAGVLDGHASGRFQDGDALVVALERIAPNTGLAPEEQPRIVTRDDDAWWRSPLGPAVLVAGLALLAAAAWSIQRRTRANQ